MHRTKRKRNIIIFSLVGILLCMGVGYAAFQTKLEVKGTSKVTSNWNIQITNVTNGTPTGSAENNVSPSWTDLTAYMEANLYEKGDAMEYDVTIENKGTIDAKLNDILTNLENNNEAVLITFSGYNQGEILKSKENKIVHVKIEYNPEYNGGETSSEVKVDFEYTQNNNEPENPDNKYLVTYDYETNGGQSVELTQELLMSGSNVDLSNEANKEGYTFIGWNTNKDATKGLTEYKMPAHPVTLYAIYGKTIEVTYEKGINVESIGKTEDTCIIYNNNTSCEITLPSITANPGYNSVGWNIASGETTGTKAGETITISNNITYYGNAIDNIAPTKPVLTNSSNGKWTNQNVTVTVTSTDEGSKIDHYEWNENGTWTTRALNIADGVGTITFTVDRDIEAQFRAIDQDGNISEIATTPVKIDSVDPTGDITFTGNDGTSHIYYFTGPTWGTTPYSSSSADDTHSGVKSSSLICTSSNTNAATVSNEGTKSNITIKSTKGTTNNYHYLQERSTIACTLSITDNAGNTASVSKSASAGNGWASLDKFTCSAKGVEYNNWNYANGLNKVAGWIYVYHSTLNANIYYYTNSDGLMLRGWQKIGGVWYYLNDQCAYNTTYKTTSNYKYPDGGMLWNDTLIRVSDNAKWTFNANGACTSGSGC